MVRLHENGLTGRFAVVDRHVGAVVDAADNGGGGSGDLTNLGSESSLSQIWTLVGISKVDPIADDIGVSALSSENKLVKSLIAWVEVSTWRGDRQG